MAGYPAEMTEILLYPLPLIWPAVTYWRMKEPQFIHHASLTCLILTVVIQGSSILAGYLPGLSMAIYACFGSFICLLIPPWKGDVKGGVPLRAGNVALSAFYALAMAQAYNPGD